MEFLQAILPGLIQMFIIIAIALIGNFIYIQLHKRKLRKDYIEAGITPPDWGWLYREKKPKKK